MKSTNSNSTLSLTGRIDRKTYSDSTIDDIDSWGSLTKSEKLDKLRTISPDDSETVYNVTTDRLHQYFVDNLDPENTTTKSNLSVEYLGLGIDAGSGTATSDIDLNNRIYSETITDTADNGKDLLASTFIDSTEGNGQTFDELGLYTGDPQNLSQESVFLMNHSTFSPVQKDNTKTVVFDVTLTFSNV